MTKGSVQRYVPVELDKLLDDFHDTYVERFAPVHRDSVTKVFTDRIFAHMYSKMIFEKLGSGRISVKPSSKSNGRGLEIEYDFSNL